MFYYIEQISMETKQEVYDGHRKEKYRFFLLNLQDGFSSRCEQSWKEQMAIKLSPQYWRGLRFPFTKHIESGGIGS